MHDEHPIQLLQCPICGARTLYGVTAPTLTCPVCSAPLQYRQLVVLMVDVSGDTISPYEEISRLQLDSKRLKPGELAACTFHAGEHWLWITSGGFLNFQNTLPHPPAEPEPAPTLLQEADALIHGERAEDYGDARVSFQHIAGLWGAYLGQAIRPSDVAALMALLKMSRVKHSGYQHHDSFVDAAGYIALAKEVAK